MRSYFACILLIILGVFIIGLTMRSVWGNPMPSDILQNLNTDPKPYGVSPERNRFLLTQNLVEHKSFALSSSQAKAASPDVGFYKGNWFIYFAPGMSIFAVPFYIIGSKFHLAWFATSAMVGLFTLANLVFIFLISRHVLKLPYWAGILAAVIFGFASTSLNYAANLYQHEASTFFILSSFFAAYQYRTRKRWKFVLGFFVWTNYALAILIDYPNALLMLPVMFYFVANSISFNKVGEKIKLNIKPSIALTSICFVFIMVLHGYYNHVNFGGWTHLSGTSLKSQKAMMQQAQTPKKTSQATPVSTANASIATPSNPVAALIRESNLVNSSYELLVAPDKGIFVFSPIFLLGILGIILAVRKQNFNIQLGTLMALVGVNIFFYSSWSDPWGGWAYGPRYLIPSMAILAIFVVYFLTYFKYQMIAKVVAMLLFTYSTAVALIGALTTDAVPPKGEAIALHSNYGILYDWDFLIRGMTRSFAYNYYFHNFMSLTDYYLLLFVFISAIGIFLIVLIPGRNKLHNYSKA
jgi:hypothetical protein